MRFFIALMIVAIGALKSSVAQQPVLFGTTTTGNGGIYRYDSKEDAIKNVYRFKNSGIFDRSKMILARNGKIYGVAQGGPFGYGVIYSIDPATSKYTIEKNFREVDGAEPISLVQGKDGKIYGTTDRGNGNHYPEGVLFSLDPVTSEFRVVLFFNDVGTFQPGELTSASDGLLYGIGSNFTNRFVYSYNPVTGKFQEETNLSEEVAGQSGAMIEGADGILYGVSTSGGANEVGSIFSYSLKTKEVKNLFDFNSETGKQPRGSLILASDGKLYSTTSNVYGSVEGGAIFCFDPQAKTMKVIHEFDEAIGGSTSGALAEGADGKLYGMTLKTPRDQNSENPGSIFYSIDKSGNNYKVVRSFDHPTKYPLDGNLLFVKDKIYGIAEAEKSIPYPYIFSYQISTDLFQKIIQTNQDKGFRPLGQLLHATDGRLYGIATQGGGFERGGLFSFNPATLLYTMLLPFNEDRGIMKDGLVQASNGKIFGSTTGGGAYKNGVIFSYDPDKSRYVVLKSMPSGSAVLFGFAIGNDGHLYSALSRQTAQYTSENILFSINPLTGAYKEFNNLDVEEFPLGAFVSSSDGKLYAFAHKGILSYDAKANSHHVYPYAENLVARFGRRLVEGPGHKLYWIEKQDSAPFENVIYSFDPTNGSFSNPYPFPSYDYTQYSGFSDLTYASDGLFYGTTNSVFHDKYTLGRMFSFDPLTKSFVLLREFNEYTGGMPLAGQLVELNTSIPPILSITDKKLAEGDTAKLTVSLNRISNEEIVLNYWTVAGTASDKGEHPDYIPASGQIIIPPGKVSATLSVSLLKDEVLENREVFTVVLQKANEALFHLGDSIGVINIKNENVPTIPPAEQNIKFYGIALTENIAEYIFSYETNENFFREIIRPDRSKAAGISTWMQARDGIFYGTLGTVGGTFGSGGIFSFNPASGTFALLFAFPNVDREPTQANKLVQADNGKLYGLTAFDGGGNRGVIFSYDSDESKYVIEKALDSNVWPTAAFALGKDGLLYSVINNDFTGENFIISFNPNTREYNQLAKLCCDYVSGFTLTADGKLYGVAHSGIYIFDPTSNGVEFFSFPDQSRGHNYGETLVEAADHKLYGTSQEFGNIDPQTNRMGILYSFDPANKSFATLFTFDENSGYDPLYKLECASDGRLYGITLSGGKNSKGTLFRFDPINQSFKLLRQLEVYAGLLLESNVSRPPIVSNMAQRIGANSPHAFSGIQTVKNDEIQLKVMPNPSSDFFTVHIGGIKADRVSVTVTNLSGQIMNKFDGVMKNSQLVFGQNYRSGSYFVQVVDGKESKVIKLIKTSK